MDDDRVTMEEAHKAFAAGYNGKVWELLEKSQRSEEDNIRMLHFAHASCAHWLEAGTGVHHQRGEWMISRVNSELGFHEAALRHAEICQRLTEDYADEMADFDLAYAYEAMARAYAAGNDRKKALQFIKKAETAGGRIANSQDRKIFQGDLNSGNWNGIR